VNALRGRPLVFIAIVFANVAYVGCANSRSISDLDVLRERVIAHQQAVRMQTAFDNESSNDLLARWHPRIHDISPESKEWEKFTFILNASVPVKYVVKKNDHLDRILRSRLFVSSSDEPRAYREYVRSIRKRNPRMSFVVLHPGQTIDLPSGPHYEAVESTVASLNDYCDRLIESLQIHVPPSSLRRATSTKCNQAVVQRLAFRRIGYLSTAYHVNPPPLEPSTLLRERVVKEISSRRVLPPRGLDPTRDYDVIRIRPDFLPASMAADTGPALELGIVDAPIINCKSPCSGCAQQLQSAQYPANGLSRLLIADSGASVSLPLDPSSLFYSTALGQIEWDGQPLTPRQLQKNDVDDLSDMKHGTYIYAEVSNRYKGVLPDSAIYIARIVKKDETAPFWSFDHQAIHNAFIYFDYIRRSEEKNHGSGTLPTWVVSLSVHSRIKIVPFIEDYIAAPSDDNLLFVAAVGNEFGKVNLTDTMYSKKNSSKANLLLVGALSENDTKEEYSNFDPNLVDIFARGDCICGSGSTNPGGKPPQLNGTSQATPIVAVAATVLAEQFHKWNAQRIKWRIISSSDLPCNFFNYSVGGNLNFPRALNNQQLVILGTKRAVSCRDRETTEDIPIKRLDDSDGHWDPLLDTSRITACANTPCEILRLHRSRENGPTAFRRFIYEQSSSSDIVQIDDNVQLSYFDVSGARQTKPASEFEDIIFQMPVEPSEPSPVIE